LVLALLLVLLVLVLLHPPLLTLRVARIRCRGRIAAGRRALLERLACAPLGKAMQC
jgi:hypothetical protein